ncbi:hypothetical protein GCM10009416_41280 [Craurococcus roseus]|uniref:Uncharacterized protein n=1 Tax=Craurococcus roseus TaxID=77585 RepID=A0ABP3QWB0_9PROT
MIYEKPLLTSMVRVRRVLRDPDGRSHFLTGEAEGRVLRLDSGQSEPWKFWVPRPFPVPGAVRHARTPITPADQAHCKLVPNLGRWAPSRRWRWRRQAFNGPRGGAGRRPPLGPGW